MQIELRSNSVVLDGYVNAVDRDSRTLAMPDGKLFVERVSPGTFSKALERTSNVELRYNHVRVIGGTENGNFELYEDPVGLRAKAIVTDVEVVEKAKNNELRGWSFGFRSLKDRWEDVDGTSRRYLEDIYLKEVSILDKTPAYIGTSVEYRDNETYIVEFRIQEDETNDISMNYHNDIQYKNMELSKQKYRRMNFRRK